MAGWKGGGGGGGGFGVLLCDCLLSQALMSITIEVIDYSVKFQGMVSVTSKA